MSPGELLSADDHLSECEECRNQLTEEKKLKASFTHLQADMMVAEMESNHLHYEQMEAYVDKKLDDVDREVIESHLDLCHQCKGEIDDLLAFKSSMTSYLAKEIKPSEETSLWKRFLDFWQGLMNWAPLRLAGAAAMVLLLLFSVLMVKQVSDLRTEVGELQRTNSELQSQAAKVAQLEQEVATLRERPGNSSGSSPKLIAALYDGDRLVTLDGSGKVSGLPSNYEQVVGKALQRQQAEISGLAELNKKSDKLMGDNDENYPFTLLGPVGKVVETDRPTFYWKPFAGATSYTVGVYDSSFNEVAKSGAITKTEWTMTHSLERGRIYFWQVAAIKDGEEIKSPRPPPQLMRFKVLEREKAESLEQAKRTSGDSHLVLGTLYAQAGMLEEAQREFKSLVEANPKSIVAQKLLHSVQKQ